MKELSDAQRAERDQYVAALREADDEVERIWSQVEAIWDRLTDALVDYNNRVITARHWRDEILAEMDDEENPDPAYERWIDAWSFDLDDIDTLPDLPDLDERCHAVDLENAPDSPDRPRRRPEPEPIEPEPVF
jgi:hypothetical protein